MEILKKDDFESPFLKFGRMDSEEDAVKEAKALLEEIVKVSALESLESKEVVRLLLKSTKDLGGGNVLHGLVTEMVFASPRNQLAVFKVILEEQALRADLLAEEDDQKSTPLEYAKTHMLESVFITVLDLQIEESNILVGILNLAMQQKNHELVARIYNHPNFKITMDEQILYFEYMNSYTNKYVKEKQDLDLASIKDILSKLEADIRYIDDRSLQEKYAYVYYHDLKKLLYAEFNAGWHPQLPLTSSIEYTEHVSKVFNEMLNRNISLLSLFLISKGKIKDEISTLLYSDGFKKDPLLLASEHGCIETRKKLVRFGVKLGKIYFEFMDELNDELFDLWLEQHPPYLFEDFSDNGVPLLSILSAKGRVGRVRKLIAAGAYIEERDSCGQTPLHIVAKSIWRDVLEALLKAGAHINACDVMGRTPLHIAAQSNSRDAVELLIKAGADINARDNNGQTPLHVLVQANFRVIAAVLLINGADLEAKDSQGKTPYDLAANYDNFLQPKGTNAPYLAAFSKIIMARKSDALLSEGSVSSTSLSQNQVTMNSDNVGHLYITYPQEQKLIEEILEKFPDIGRGGRGNLRE